MGSGRARWIAIALIAALLAVLAVGLVSGGPETVGSDDGTDEGDDPRSATATEGLDGPHVLVELCTGATCPALDEAEQQALVAELEADPRVASLLFVSSEQAYELFLDRYGDQEDLVDRVEPEDVPARVELDLFDPDAVPEVMAAHRQREGVADVYDARTVTP